MTTQPPTPNTLITYATRHRISRWLRANTVTALRTASTFWITFIFVSILNAYGYDTGYLKIVHVAVLVGMLFAAINWILTVDAGYVDRLIEQSQKPRIMPWPLFMVRMVASAVVFSFLFTLMFTAIYDYINFSHVLVAYGASIGGASLLRKVRQLWPVAARGLVDLVVILVWVVTTLFMVIYGYSGHVVVDAAFGIYTVSWWSSSVLPPKEKLD